MSLICFERNVSLDTFFLGKLVTKISHKFWFKYLENKEAVTYSPKIIIIIIIIKIKIRHVQLQ